ncbi:hypothetical protein MYAM1_003256 [Malassezia yamatoensis]|uniref:Uncharacterized protein n=1 Tax=Malassezia yamatoensis TaxID=253288 RepID=A0AAJ5YXF5_9BASI|nr:hypothetical protein MYAM1_003256 [Malassezia yamatoensis]
MSHERVHVRRSTAVSCKASDLYLAPKGGSTISVGDVQLQWNAQCFSGENLDIYLYAQQQQTAVRPIHAWLNLPSSPGQANVQFLAKWWNGTDQIPMNLQMVPSGGQAWATSYPMSNTFKVSNPSGQPTGTESASSDHVTRYGTSFGQMSAGPLAAAIVVPILAVLALIAGAFFWLFKRKQRQNQQRAHAHSINSTYASSSTQDMSQAPSVRPVSLYESFPYHPEPSEGMDQYYSHAPDQSIEPEKSLPMVPADKQSNDSLADLTGSHGNASSSTLTVSDPDQISLEPENRPTTRRPNPRHTLPRRVSSRNADSWYDRPYGTPAMDAVRSPRESSRRQSRRHTPQHKPRRSTLEYPARSFHREERAAPLHTYTMDEAPEPANLPTSAKQNNLAPAVPIQYMQEANRDPFTFMDDTNQRRVSSQQVGSRSASEKVLSYLSQLPSFENAGNTGEAPATEFPTASTNPARHSSQGMADDRRSSRARHATKEANPRSRPTSMHTTHSRPVSMDGTMFHDAITDDQDD